MGNGVAWAAGLFEGEGSIVHPRNERYKTQYYWRVSRANDVHRILLLFIPYLGVRRGTKAVWALARIANSRGLTVA